MRLFGSLVRLCVVLLAAMLVAQARDVGDMSSTEITALQQCLADGGCYQGAIDGQASPALQAAIRACPSQDPIVRIETGMHVATSQPDQRRRGVPHRRDGVGRQDRAGLVTAGRQTAADLKRIA